MQLGLTSTQRIQVTRLANSNKVRPISQINQPRVSYRVSTHQWINRLPKSSDGVFAAIGDQLVATSTEDEDGDDVHYLDDEFRNAQTSQRHVIRAVSRPHRGHRRRPIAIPVTLTLHYNHLSHLQFLFQFKAISNRHHLESFDEFVKMRLSTSISSMENGCYFQPITSSKQHIPNRRYSSSRLM